MPKKKLVRYANAASVRRRLVFDDELVDDSVTFSVGKCVTDGVGVATEPESRLAFDQAELSLPETSRSECEEFRRLLMTNPVISNTTEGRNHDSNNYVKLKSGYEQDHDRSTMVVDVPLTSCYCCGYFTLILCVLVVVLCFIVGLITSVSIAFVLALSCCGFSWMIIYFDSLKPGRIPPSPLSPSKYRKKSGHTFHLNYVMSFICGFVVFAYYLWLSSDNYVP
ncbi:hypothetical protein LSH36_763g00014 [Paralvinella palmiformis]|uniref:Uncharacterized protein n=1 Tax=Paralvinella palmiformis TaxID=53620 RepID=A0AAD9J0L4_9ANNE|nr:hypothetical protein LSH36_763g00014 [Paralvinella palmiformis]